MPPLLTPSPIILDQSFPRNVPELRLVLIALGEMIDCIKNRESVLLLTDILCEIANGENIDWERPIEGYELLREIYQLFCQWFMKQHDGIINISTSEIDAGEPHPIPYGCVGEGLVEIWADEMGKVLWLHDSKCGTEGYCIGVGCAYAFAGDNLGKYNAFRDCRAFPLVGREELKRLGDAYTWKLHTDVLRKKVRFEDVKKNAPILGATSIEDPDGGSHYKVNFQSGYKWTIDDNYDFVPDKFINELIPVTGLPKEIIKWILIVGVLPDKVLTILD